MQENGPQILEQHFGSPLESSLALKIVDYVHPREVVQTDQLSPTEKRAILSAWASDACAVESWPGLRWLRGTPGPISVDHVLAALRTLDDMAGQHNSRNDAPVRRRPGQTRHGHLFAQSAKRGSPMEGVGR